MIDQKFSKWLNEKLSYYQKIFLFINCNSWKSFCTFEKELNLNKKVLILSTFELKYDNADFTVQQITKSEMEQICSLFKLYEFSDYLTIISDEANAFPNLELFRRTGLLTEQEIWQAVIF